MKFSRLFAVALATLLLFSAVNAQKAELTVNLNEAFFDALLESVFQNAGPLEFPIAGVVTESRPRDNSASVFLPAAFAPVRSVDRANPACPDSVRILREMDGVRTAVRIRDGRIYVPMAFSGNYAPPFVGCVEFAGWAETTIDLEFDQAGQRLVGRARVLNVNLSGTGGLGGTVIAKMIQASIDRKFNPIEVVSLEKMSFLLPIRGSGSVRARAVSAQPELTNASVTLRINYVFEKG